MSANRRFTDTIDETTTILGRGIKIQGEITGPASIEVWGKLSGNAGTEGLFLVREGGHVHGEIAATHVVVEGEIEGKIHAEEKIELRPTCKVKGNVEAKTVAIAEGAYFEGRISMAGGGKGQLAVQSFREKRRT